MITDLDPRFTRQGPKKESFSGNHISGYIAVERVGLLQRRMCHIFGVGRKEFPEHAIDQAREFMIAMDRPQENQQ